MEGETPDNRQVDRALTSLSALGLPEPGWPAVRVRRGHHDRRPVTVVRFQPGGYRLGGPHLTVVLDDSDRVPGFTLLHHGPHQADPELADVDRARAAAVEFFQRTDPCYAAGLEELWIAEHTETVVDDTGQEHRISGMKVKNRHDGGLYAWVVVDRDGQVITVEREVTWDSSAGRRATQMWLHDRWIDAHDRGHPAPDPPYAPI
jgi:hypothetical protein